MGEGDSRGRVVDDLGRTWEYRPDGWHCLTGEDDESSWVDVPYTWDEMAKDYGPVIPVPLGAAGARNSDTSPR